MVIKKLAMPQAGSEIIRVQQETPSALRVWSSSWLSKRRVSHEVKQEKGNPITYHSFHYHTGKCATSGRTV